MNQQARVMFKFSGSIFTLVAAMLFYNHLFVAAQNPGFFVVAYFNYYGEFYLEMILFLCFIPFILFSFATEFKNTYKYLQKAKRQKYEILRKENDNR